MEYVFKATAKKVRKKKISWKNKRKVEPQTFSTQRKMSGNIIGEKHG